MEGHGYMENLLDSMKDARIEVLDLELADGPDAATKDLSDLIDLALDARDEAWFMELTERQKELTACM